MCSLTIFKDIDSNDVYFTHNRDESIHRHLPNDGLHLISNQEQSILMPIDPISQGTWIGTTKNRTAAILNGYQVKHLRKPTYRSSRGLIIPQLLRSESFLAFIHSSDFTDIEPFTLLVYDTGVIYESGWDGQNFHYKQLDPDQLHYYASPTLYSPEVIDSRKQLFEGKRLTPKSVLDIHVARGKDHHHFLNVKFSEVLMSISVSQIKCGELPSFFYKSLV